MKKLIKMPKLSADMKTGIIVLWNKKTGDEIKKGEIIFEVETDKVVSEVESVDSGILKETFFEEGDAAGVDETIAVLDTEE
jgi:pyruvate/2-oxoglutarate dehydrogenase complex dihydrolipoamide acyltransferase (E2) component